MADKNNAQKKPQASGSNAASGNTKDSENTEGMIELQNFIRNISPNVWTYFIPCQSCKKWFFDIRSDYNPVYECICVDCKSAALPDTKSEAKYADL